MSPPISSHRGGSSHQLWRTLTVGVDAGTINGSQGCDTRLWKHVMCGGVGGGGGGGGGRGIVQVRARRLVERWKPRRSQGRNVDLCTGRGHRRMPKGRSSSKRTIQCVCGASLSPTSLKAHLRSKRHADRLARSTPADSPTITDSSPTSVMPSAPPMRGPPDCPSSASASRSAAPPIPPSAQDVLDDWLNVKFGQYYDSVHDRFPLDAISARTNRPPNIVANQIRDLLLTTSPFFLTGCWTYPRRRGPLYVQVFEIRHGSRTETVLGWPTLPASTSVMRSSAIRHHPLRCELMKSLCDDTVMDREDTAEEESFRASSGMSIDRADASLSTSHLRCCRPSHLAIGSAHHNAMDMILRKQIQTSSACRAAARTMLERIDSFQVVMRLFSSATLADLILSFSHPCQD